MIFHIGKREVQKTRIILSEKTCIFVCMILEPVYLVLIFADFVNNLLKPIEKNCQSG